jgi:hypothetical protein
VLTGGEVAADYVKGRQATAPVQTGSCTPD